MSSIAINVDFLKSWNGIFKSLQLVLGTICVGIFGYHLKNYINISAMEYYFLVAIWFSFIGTFILFISYLISPAAASMIPKTIYEFLYYSIASILLLAASIAMMVNVNYYKDFPLFGYKSLLALTYSKDFPLHDYKSLLAVSICSLVNTVLYICGAVIGFISYGKH